MSGVYWPASPIRIPAPISSPAASVATAQETLPGTPNMGAVVEQWDTDAVGYAPQDGQPISGQPWIAPPAGQPQMGPPITTYSDPAWGGPSVVLPCSTDDWYWQVLPDGLIYHSYWAGVHEPRLGIVAQKITHGDSFLDGTVGGRAGDAGEGACSAWRSRGRQRQLRHRATPVPARPRRPDQLDQSMRFGR